MRFSESLKKNKDFQLTYKKGKVLCEQIPGHVCQEEWNFQQQTGSFGQQKGREQCGPPPGYTIIERKLSTSGRLFPAWI